MLNMTLLLNSCRLCVQVDKFSRERVHAAREYEQELQHLRELHEAQVANLEGDKANLRAQLEEAFQKLKQSKVDIASQVQPPRTWLLLPRIISWAKVTHPPRYISGISYPPVQLRTRSSAAIAHTLRNSAPVGLMHPSHKGLETLSECIPWPG